VLLWLLLRTRHKRKPQILNFKRCSNGRATHLPIANSEEIIGELLGRWDSRELLELRCGGRSVGRAGSYAMTTSASVFYKHLLVNLKQRGIIDDYLEYFSVKGQGFCRFYLLKSHWL
jgi:hypothetical protein